MPIPSLPRDLSNCTTVSVTGEKMPEVIELEQGLFHVVGHYTCRFYMNTHGVNRFTDDHVKICSVSRWRYENFWLT